MRRSAEDHPEQSGVTLLTGIRVATQLLELSIIGLVETNSIETQIYPHFGP